MGYREDRDAESAAWDALAAAYVEYVRVRGLHAGRYLCPIEIRAHNADAGVRGSFHILVQKDGAVTRAHADWTPRAARGPADGGGATPGEEAT